MLYQAYATLAIEENYQAIVSESAAQLTTPLIEAWVVKHGPSLFIRDVKSPMNGVLVTLEGFHKVYEFEEHDNTDLFRKIKQK